MRQPNPKTTRNPVDLEDCEPCAAGTAASGLRDLLTGRFELAFLFFFGIVLGSQYALESKPKQKLQREVR
jgi:hypothetical protein